jgi:hypothetical protein
MGREVRVVPKNWEHPKDARGNYLPLLKWPYSKEMSDWIEGREAWDRGEVPDYSAWPKRLFKPKDEDITGSFEEYEGDLPEQASYMPEWASGEATMLMMYENTSEGTPVSPAFETPEQLARWLADTRASAFGGMTATYEQWLATCKSGYAPSAVICGGHMMSGVEAADR